MSQTAKIEDLPQDMQTALTWVLGYIDCEQWDDAVAEHDAGGVRRAVIELRKVGE